MGNRGKLTVICGHYGCGKTNLTLNLALNKAKEGRQVTVVDLDIVNPYFRSSEYRELLKQHHVRLIAPVFAGTTLDTPTLPPEIYSIFESEGPVFLDAGGDDAGAVALGGLFEQFSQREYEMLYVINRYRILSQTPGENAQLLREIEAASRLRATGVVNNSHLGVETTLSTVLSALPFAEETAKLCMLPLCYSTIPNFAIEEGAALPKGLLPVERYVKFSWED